MAEFSFYLTKKDLRQFYWSQVWQRKSHLLFAGALSLLAAWQWFRGRGLAGAVVAGALFALCYFAWVGLNWVLWSRQLSEESGLIGPRKFRVEEQGLFLQTGAGQGQIAWSAISAIRQTPSAVHLIVKPHTTVIIPRRAFPDPIDETQFLETVTQLMKSVAVPN